MQWAAPFAFTQPHHYWVLGLGMVTASCCALVQPTVSIFLGKFIDAIAQFGGGLIDSDTLQQRITPMVHAFIVLGCCTFVTNAGMFVTWTTFGEMQAKSVREELFRSLLDKNLEWFEMRESSISSLLTRLQT
jgi:ATP-binding cassette, subfamily B (MDR/TAP), member 1